MRCKISEPYNPPLPTKRRRLTQALLAGAGVAPTWAPIIGAPFRGGVRHEITIARAPVLERVVPEKHGKKARLHDMPTCS